MCVKALNFITVQLYRDGDGDVPGVTCRPVIMVINPHLVSVNDTADRVSAASVELFPTRFGAKLRLVVTRLLWF